MPELDGLRGIAALVIVVFHMRFVEALPILGAAVDLFFVLSGFLITSILLRHVHTLADLRVFYLRRALRIWPIYYLAILVLFPLDRWLLPGPTGLAGLPWYLAYLQLTPIYFGMEQPLFDRMFDHTWSLAVEEQFYLVAPIVLVATRGRAALPMAIGLILIASTMRILGFPRVLLLSRCDGLGWGMLLAVWSASWPRVDQILDRRLRRTLIFILVGAIGAIGMASTYGSTLVDGLSVIDRLSLSIGERTGPDQFLMALRLTWVGPIFFCWVGLSVMYTGSFWQSGLRMSWLTGLGTISYGLYLIHPFVFAYSTRLQILMGIPGSPWLDALKVLGAIGLAWLSWRMIERPILAWKSRFPYCCRAGAQTDSEMGVQRRGRLRRIDPPNHCDSSHKPDATDDRSCSVERTELTQLETGLCTNLKNVRDPVPSLQQERLASRSN